MALDAAARAALATGPLADVLDPATVRSSEVAFHGKIWNVDRDTFDAAGREVVREYLSHPGAVAILALDADDRVLLINQYRHAIRTREWELPAGLRDVPGEEPLATAQRELAEEADLAASDWDELITYRTSPGGSDEVVHVFRATGLRATPRFERAEEEAEIVVRWVPLRDVVTAILEGRVGNSILDVAVLAEHARRG